MELKGERGVNKISERIKQAVILQLKGASVQRGNQVSSHLDRVAERLWSANHCALQVSSLCSAFDCSVKGQIHEVFHRATILSPSLWSSLGSKA